MYFFFTNKAKFLFILFTALIAAAPFKSVVELAAEADVFGTLSVRVDETLTLLKFKQINYEKIIYTIIISRNDFTIM